MPTGARTKPDNAFYLEIEAGVREVVRALRDAGVNTECSCHHEGYVQCQSVDPYTEQMRIFNVMRELGIREWKATLHVVHTASLYHSSWEITSEAFKCKGADKCMS
jgi:hypothetical protein